MKRGETSFEGHKDEKKFLKMKRKLQVNIARNFEEAEEFDHADYAQMTSKERVDTAIWLRDHYYKTFSKGKRYGSPRRLRRVIKVVQQT